MKISDKLTSLNHDRYAQWSAKFDNAQDSRASILAFKGDVYLGLDAPSMNKRDFSWAKNACGYCLACTACCGRWIVSTPIDWKWVQTGQRPWHDLYEFWGSKVTDALNATLAEQRKGADQSGI